MSVVIDQPGVLETDSVSVRTIRESDLDSVVKIDAAWSGRRRPRYFEGMFERSLKESPLQISLAAELDGRVRGFLLASLYYGEYGIAEPSASIDAIGVDPEARGKNVGAALMRQLRLNLGALGVTRLRTEVEWNDHDLLHFLEKEGFLPAQRLCLECRIDPTMPEM